MHGRDFSLLFEHSFGVLLPSPPAGRAAGGSVALCSHGGVVDTRHRAGAERTAARGLAGRPFGDVSLSGRVSA
jgi:hypothetical protein